MVQSPFESENIDAEPIGTSPYDSSREPPRVVPAGKPFPWGCLLGGCFTVTLLMVGLVVAAGFGTYRYYQQQLAQYTSTEARQLPVVDIAPEELKELETRVETFQEKVDKGEAPETLVLTSDELNALISQQEKLRGRVFVTIEDGLIQAEVSFPTDGIPGAQGRFFNGSAGIDAAIENGELVVKLDSAEVNGQSVPEAIMVQLRKENLAKEINKNPEIAKTIAKFERLVIEGDKLILTPKAEPAEPVEPAEPAVKSAESPQ